MNGFPFSRVCILMHDDDGFSPLSFDHSASSDYGNINNLVVVNTLYINVFASSCNDTYVFASNASVGASVDESAPSSGTMVGRDVQYLGHADFAVCLAIDLDVFGLTGFHGCREAVHGIGQEPCDVTWGQRGTLGDMCK
jgi:hypothetical protein